MTLDSFYSLVSGRRGHFRMESGMHSALWLDLDALFTDRTRVAPFVAALAALLRPSGAAVVCGPRVGGAVLAERVAANLGVDWCQTVLTANSKGGLNTTVSQGGLFSAQYSLSPIDADRVKGKEVAIVDDVISAGSSVRATQTELEAHGARVAVVGTLLLLGNIADSHFTSAGIPLEAVHRDRFDMWTPASCPLCADGVALEATSS